MSSYIIVAATCVYCNSFAMIIFNIFTSTSIQRYAGTFLNNAMAAATLYPPIRFVCPPVDSHPFATISIQRCRNIATLPDNKQYSIQLPSVFSDMVLYGNIQQNSYIPQTEQYLPFGLMLPCLGNVTII